MSDRYHYVEDDALVRAVRRLATEEDRDQFEKVLRRWLARQPGQPDLVGATSAAKILGVYPPHITRLRAQGRMPEPVPIDGSVDVYVRAEVEALAKKLKAERDRRKA